MHRWQQLALGVTALAVAASPLGAQERARPKALTISAHNLMADTPERRESLPQGSDPEALYPGDVVGYRLVFTNIIDVPVRNIEFTDPIPDGLIYVQGSSTSSGTDVTIEYSIDQGVSYHATPMIRREASGAAVFEPAPPEAYTHIRWRVSDWVQPGASVTAEFRATLPDIADPTQASSRTGRDR